MNVKIASPFRIPAPNSAVERYNDRCGQQPSPSGSTGRGLICRRGGPGGVQRLTEHAADAASRLDGEWLDLTRAGRLSDLGRKPILPAVAPRPESERRPC
jgi:hypothetical protein